MCKESKSGGGGGQQIPETIQARVTKVREMVKKSQYGELQGDIKVTRDGNGKGKTFKELVDEQAEKHIMFRENERRRLNVQRE